MNWKMRQGFTFHSNYFYKAQKTTGSTDADIHKLTGSTSADT